MAISDSDDSVGTAAEELSSRADSDLRNRSVRRRPGAGGGGATPDSETRAGSPGDEAGDGSLASKAKRGGDSGEGRTARSAGSVDEKKENVERTANSGDHGFDLSAAKLLHRPAAPAHRKVRESRLSSGAIFRQVYRLLLHVFALDSYHRKRALLRNSILMSVGNFLWC